MPASPALARPAPRVPTREPDIVAIFVVVMMAAALLTAVSSALLGPDRVDVDLRNPTAYEITVGVRDGPDGSLLLLGTLAPGSDRTFTGVLDRGDDWRFEFSYAGVDAGVMDLEEPAAIEAPVVVPDDVADVLEREGLDPSPA